MIKNKKEELQEELDLDSLGIDIDKIDDKLLSLVYNFISKVYCNVRENDQIDKNNELNNYTEKLTKEGRQNVDKKDS